MKKAACKNYAFNMILNSDIKHEKRRKSWIKSPPTPHRNISMTICKFCSQLHFLTWVIRAIWRPSEISVTTTYLTHNMCTAIYFIVFSYYLHCEDLSYKKHKNSDSFTSICKTILAGGTNYLCRLIIYHNHGHWTKFSSLAWKIGRVWLSMVIVPSEKILDPSDSTRRPS